MVICGGQKMNKYDPNEKFSYIPFSEYSKKFEDTFAMKRENGIIEVRMHREGGVAEWGERCHKGWGQVFKYVGQDPENEILIISGTGDRWMIDGGMAEEAKEKMIDLMINEPDEFRRDSYNGWYADGLPLLYNLVHDVNIPTIGVINGPGMHTEFPLICDITLAAPDAELFEPHFAGSGTVAGDGQYLVFQEIMGVKLANKLVYSGAKMTAEEAEKLGIFTEVVERDKLLDRAWEIARFMLTRNRYVRILQHEVTRRRWRRVFEQDLSFNFALESWAECIKSGNSKSTVNWDKWE